MGSLWSEGTDHTIVYYSCVYERRSSDAENARQTPSVCRRANASRQHLMGFYLYEKIEILLMYTM